DTEKGRWMVQKCGRRGLGRVGTGPPPSPCTNRLRALQARSVPPPPPPLPAQPVLSAGMKLAAA
ncbi:hypothetical protein P7K49_019748, partial [Saguinus oedipus]